MPRIILCADDSPTIQKVIELTFADTDLRVVCVSDGDAAIRRYRELRPDAVLLDIVMPLRSGYEVCEYIKKESGADAPPVLLLSSSFEPFDPERARAAQADGHMPKPFESQALRERVNALLGPPAASAPASFPSAAPLPAGEAPSSPAAHDSPSDPEDQVSAGAASTPFEHAAVARGASAVSGDGRILSSEDIDAIARRLVDIIGADIVREVAWEIVPDLVDMMVRRRLDEQDPGGGRKP